MWGFYEVRYPTLVNGISVFIKEVCRNLFPFSITQGCGKKIVSERGLPSPDIESAGA
jgi:hypothetical protein